ncbi:MAG: LuxR C-terminal-related transcriptional regulator [Brevinematia bacterium]
MKILSLFYVIAFLVYLSFGIYIFYLYISEKKKNSLFRTFFVLCLFFSVSSLNYAFLVSSKTVEDCWFWFKMTVPALAFFPAILLHFFFNIGKVNTPKLRWIIVIDYIFASIFLIRGLTGTFTITEFVEKEYGWEGIHATNSPWYLLYTLYYISNLVVCSVIIFLILLRTKSIRQKKQAKTMLVFSITTSLINIIIQTILPLLGIYVIPKAPLVIMLVWIFGIWYSMIKYRFMIPTLQLNSSEIISNIDEMVLILDIEFNIIEVNKQFLDLVCLKNNEIFYRKFFDFVSLNDNIKNCLFSLINGEAKNFYCRIDFKDKFEKIIITDSYISVIKDRFSDIVGILIISKENTDISQFQRIYKITDREFEVIELSVNGFSNLEISKKLGISERTVETHLNNIYNKLGINKKIELYNIANNFNIIKNKKL